MSKYGDALDALDQDSADRRAAVQTVAGHFNPDQYAQALTRSKETGVPAQIIAKNPEPFKRPSKYGAAIDAMDAPTTHEWLSTLDNAAVAQDDVENLSAMEALIRRRAVLTEKFEAVPRVAARLPGNIGKSAWAMTREMAHGAERYFSDVNEGMARAAIESYRDANVMPLAQQEVAVNDALERYTQARLQSAKSAVGAAAASKEGEEAIPKDAGAIERGIQQGVSSALVTVPAVLTLGPEAALPLMGLGAGGSRYSQLRDKGLSKEEAALSGALIGSVEVLTEYLPGETLVKNVPGFWNHIAKFMASELPGENIASMTQLLDDYRLNLRDDVTFADVADTMKETSLATVFGGTTQVAAAQIVKRLADRTNQRGDGIDGANEGKAVAEQIHSVAQESKLAQRSPEKLEELVAKLKEAGGGDNVYIEPEAFRTLYQSDEEAAQAAQELTGSAQTYYEAAVSNSRMAIPIEKYVSRIATNKDAQKILEGVSFSPEAPTVNDAKEVTELAEKVEDTETPADTSQAIYDDVLGQLLQTGMEQATAEKNATLMQSVFRTLAQRTGSDAQQLYGRYGLKVQRNIPGIGNISRVDTVLDPLIDQLRAGDIPTEAQATAALDAGDIRAMDRRATLVQLSDFLNERGVDLKTADNTAVKKIIGEQTQFDQADKSNPDGKDKGTGVDSSRGQPSRNPGNASDQDGLRTVAGSKPDAGWQTATRIRGKSGRPLRIYRGGRPLTKADFSDDALGKASGNPSSGLGVFFTTDQTDASRYGDVSSSFLDIRKPLLVKVEDLPAFNSLDESIAWREKQKAAGHDGLVIQSSHLGGPNWVVAFSPEQVIPEARTLEQSFNETKRGAITFGADRQFTISLLERADLSTFLHESAHFYLEVMGDIAEQPAAPQQVKDDYEALLKWFGVSDRASIDTEQHEQFARGFESYLMEGKAPSVELQTVFARFRAWLVSVYRTFAKLNIELTPSVRRVMDRLVATDEEIDAAQRAQNYAPIFSNAEEAGMSEEQWKAYKNIAARAHQESVEELTDGAMKVLKREQQAWWKEERAKKLGEVTAEVNQQPVYQALAFLKQGKNADGSDLVDVEPKKLNKAALVEKYGKDFVKRLPSGITSKDGISADVAGQMFGFTSGDSLVEALANARPKKQLIEMETDARMREQYGDMLTDGSMAEEAMKAVHTEGRAKVMAAELKALARKRNEVKKFVNAEKRTAEREDRQAREANESSLPTKDELAAIKLGVARIMQAKKAWAIQPNTYRFAEAKAARLAFNAAAKGDYDTAYAEKRRQILNHELYRVATKAREEIDGIADYMRTFDKKATRERIAKAKGQYLEQIDALRERFDFTSVSNIADLKRDALSKWVAEQQAAGREVNVPEDLLNEAKRTPYKALTLVELQGLHDAVKNIEHLAETKDRMLKNKAATEWRDAKAELKERGEAQKEGGAPPLGRFDQSTLSRMGDGVKGIADSLLRPETIFEYMDGGTTGPWHDYFWNLANDSENVRDELREKVGRPLFDLANRIDRKRRNQLQEMVDIPSMGRALNRRTLISIVLNMGNASNLDKLTRGGYRTAEGSKPFTEQNLAEIKAALTKEDWDFVQTVWNTVNQLWPDVVEFQKRMGGLAPEKVEATPVQTRFGTYEGGYFPLVYDPTVSTQGEKQAAGDAVQEIMGSNFTRASTKKGHTKERTKVARPILLDFERVLTRHIEHVITDLSHREFVLQAMKILDDGELRALIQNRIGEGPYRSLQGMVRHTVRADGYYGDPAASGWDHVQDYLIRNTAVAALGFRAVTAFGNLVLAPIQAGARIKPKSILKGLGEFYRSPKEMTDFIHGESVFMKHRAENFDQSLIESMASLRGEKSIRAQVARAAMSVHRWADFLGTHALWIGKYRDALEQGGSNEQAVREADKAIRQTQTAGAPKDLSAFERDPRYKAFRMFLGPMVIMGNRIREAAGRKGVVKNWPEAFGTLMAVWFLPALMWELATGKGPDDEDDDGIADDAAAWALRKEFFYPFMTVPFIRDGANLAERWMTGEYAAKRSVPLAEAGELVLRAGEEAYKAGSALYEGDDVDTGALAKDWLRASGPLFGMPSNQLDVTSQYLYDVFSGEYDPEGVGDLRYLAVKR